MMRLIMFEAFLGNSLKQCLVAAGTFLAVLGVLERENVRLAYPTRLLIRE